jgi:Domain of unknown function (DUF4394)
MVPAGEAAGVPLFALTSTNRLLLFDSASPGTLTRNVAITGLGMLDVAVGIDCRPATGQLYLIVDDGTVAGQGKLYTVNPITGAATQVGSAFTLTGGFPGFDVNPEVDLIRTVSETDENFRLNPTTGAQTPDTALSYVMGDPNFGANPIVNGLAYTAAPSILYGIDSGLDIVVGFSGSPNAGLLTTIGPLGVSTGAYVGFDIAPGGTAYAALETGVATPLSSLYTVNLTTGAASFVGDIGTAMDQVWPIAGLTAACGALPTRVYSFTAKRQHRGVMLRWRTGSEMDALGFNVYRQARATRIKLNRRLLPAKAVTGGSISGGMYGFVDRRAPRRAVRYWLQAVDANGSRTWHGPVRARAAT